MERETVAMLRRIRALRDSLKRILWVLEDAETSPDDPLAGLLECYCGVEYEEEEECVWCEARRLVRNEASLPENQ